MCEYKKIPTMKVAASDMTSDHFDIKQIAQERQEKIWKQFERVFEKAIELFQESNLNLDMKRFAVYRHC